MWRAIWRELAMIDLQSLQDNWAVLTGFVAGLVAWGKTQATASSARASAIKAHERINAENDAVGDIRESVARIEAHYEHTMKAVEDIRQEQRRVAKSLSARS